MSEFNIQNSKIEQLSESGNNYKVAGNSGNIAITEKGDAVAGSKVQIDRKKENILVTVIKKIVSWVKSMFGAGRPS